MSRPPFLSKAVLSQSEKTCSAFQSLFLSALTLPNFSSPGTHSSLLQIQFFGGDTTHYSDRRRLQGDCGQQRWVPCLSRGRLPISRCLLRALSCDAGWIVSICLFQVLSLNCSSTVPGLKTTCYVACLPPVSTEPSRKPPTVCGKNSPGCLSPFGLCSFLVLEMEAGALCELGCHSATETHHIPLKRGLWRLFPVTASLGSPGPFPLRPESLGLILILVVYNMVI